MDQFNTIFIFLYFTIDPYIDPGLKIHKYNNFVNKPNCKSSYFSFDGNDVVRLKALGPGCFDDLT